MYAVIIFLCVQLYDSKWKYIEIFLRKWYVYTYIDLLILFFAIAFIVNKIVYLYDIKMRDIKISNMILYLLPRRCLAPKRPTLAYGSFIHQVWHVSFVVAGLSLSEIWPQLPSHLPKHLLWLVARSMKTLEEMTLPNGRNICMSSPSPNSWGRW